MFLCFVFDFVAFFSIIATSFGGGGGVP